MMTPSSDRIATAWLRASMYGLESAWLPDEVTISPVDPTSSLLQAALPVVDRLAEILDGTDCSVILADRDVRLVDIRHGSSAINGMLTDNNAVPGRIFTEESSGTNAIATVHELCRPLAVRGDEHFFEAMKMFSCHGFPIIHPATGRIEGVIALTFFVAEDHRLLRALVAQAADEVSSRLGDDPHPGHRHLFDAFRRAAQARGGAGVIAIAPDMVVADTTAAERLDAVDYMSLRAHDPDLTRTRPHVLASGERVDVRVQRIRSGVVIRLEDASEREGRASAGARTMSRSDRIAAVMADSRRDRSSLAVAGEAGTGRSGLLADLMAERDPVGFDAFDVAFQPERLWLQSVIDCLDAAERPVFVDNAHLLSPLTAHGLHAAATRTTGWFAVASSPLNTLSPDVFRLVDSCRTRVELLPLRLRKHEIPGLIDEILRELGADIRFTPAAIRALIAYDWPGNLTELHAEVRAASDTRSVGDVTSGDLGRLAERMSARPLGAIDDVLRTVIEDALVRHRGNKVAAAKSLDISRTTLYKRMRAFGISG